MRAERETMMSARCRQCHSSTKLLRMPLSPWTRTTSHTLLFALSVSALVNFEHCTPAAFVSFSRPMPSSLSSSSSPTSVILSEPTTPRGMTMSDKLDEHTTKRKSPRSCILQVGVSAGRLCGVGNSHFFSDKQTTTNTALVLAMTDLLVDLYRTSRSLDLNLSVSIRHKLELNNRKYPVELCKGKAGKYTQYSNVTGVTVDNQSTATAEQEHAVLSWADWVSQVPALVGEIQDFALAREWSKFHTPRNLILALLGEVGELAELVQWKGDDDNEDLKLERKELDKLSQELADVSIYLLRLASVVNVTAPLVEQLELVDNVE